MNTNIDISAEDPFYSIYNDLRDFDFSNYDNFVKLINSSSQSLCKSSYLINNSVCPKYNLSSLSLESLHDRFSVDVNGVVFDCLMTPYDLKKHKSLFVIFSGSRNSENDIIPQFKRWSYYPFINSVILNIADPMYTQYKNLKLGWYFGTKDECFLEYLSDIIKRVAFFLNIDSGDLYLFGSSGGGYAALQLSMYLPNSNHIVINPQIQIEKYFYSQKFSDLIGVDLFAYDPYRRNDTLNIIKECIHSNKGKFLILQNLQAKDDCVNHLFPLLNSLNVNTLNLGLNCQNNLLVWLYSCHGGHNTQGDQFIFSHIIYLAHKLSKEEVITPFDQYLIKNVTLLWGQIEWLKRH